MPMPGESSLIIFFSSYTCSTRPTSPAGTTGSACSGSASHACRITAHGISDCCFNSIPIVQHKAIMPYLSCCGLLVKGFTRSVCSGRTATLWVATALTSTATCAGALHTSRAGSNARVCRCIGVAGSKASSSTQPATQLCSGSAASCSWDAASTSSVANV